jgi:hypothetical protein
VRWRWVCGRVVHAAVRARPQTGRLAGLKRRHLASRFGRTPSISAHWVQSATSCRSPSTPKDVTSKDDLRYWESIVLLRVTAVWVPLFQGRHELDP